jgi:hypothetical protein
MSNWYSVSTTRIFRPTDSAISWQAFVAALGITVQSSWNMLLEPLKKKTGEDKTDAGGSSIHEASLTVAICVNARIQPLT